jgi:hypothetical protein
MISKSFKYIMDKLFNNSENEHWIKTYDMTYNQFMRLPKDIRNALRAKELDKRLKRLTDKKT